MPALKPMGVSGVPPKHVRAWTQQEDALLVGLYPSHTVPELTKHFQRTGPAIRSRIRLLLSQGVIHTKHPPPEYKRTQHAHQESPHKNHPGTRE